MEKDETAQYGTMTIGQAAKKMGVTVRTLQYYDREGLLVPSAKSEGGRRLYTHRDLVKLHQILSLKHLGFSLDDIKNRLITLESPAQVEQALCQQEKAIRKKIEDLTESLRATQALRREVAQMQSVDFKKYADIIVNLQMNNEFYWLIKHFDDQTLDHIRTRFDRDSGLEFLHTFNRLQDQALQLQDNGILPQSPQGQKLAKEYWDMVTQFTGSDTGMLSRLMEMGKIEAVEDNGLRRRQERANAFLEPALDAYFQSAGINPFEEEAK